MKNKSIWLENETEDNYKKLTEDIKCDVLIIGGGMTGISTAYHLRDSNLKICLVDRNLVGHGITSKTTGKLNYLQELILYKINRYVSQETAKNYLDSQIQTIRIVEEIINREQIDCDFEKVPSFLFTNRESEIKKIQKQKELLESFGVKVTEHNNIPIDIGCKYAISVDDTAVFHPIKYLLKLKEICIEKNINIYEKTKITAISKEENNYICKTNNNNTIIANKVVVASHYPYFLLPFFMPTKTSIEKSYVSASKIEEAKTFTAINTTNPIKSIRYHKNKKNDYLIYLNGTHKTCNNYDENANFDKLKRDLKRLKLDPQYIWSNHDIMTYDYLPFIGRIEKDNDYLLIGTGYNTWGMTNGSLAGIILSDIVLGNKNKYEDLFDPRRSLNTSKVLKYPLYLGVNAKAFIETKISKNKPWYKDNIEFKKIDGENVAIYTSEKNTKHIVYNTCPHLKCSLIFNEVEKTWDCPCHGSRFNIDGQVISGPANYDISYKKEL
jgi:glycine/D-amino acid oxidase-like deaminating enzyme/nitrite reductase/ring-hydroxylating ferredoxin subunit